MAFEEERTAPTREPRSAGHWLVLAVALFAVLTPIALGLLLEPDARGHGTHEQLGMRPCLTMERFGVPCPGCGVTTSVTLAVQGSWWESLRTQPLGTTLVAAAAFFFLWALFGHIRGRDLGERMARLSWRRWSLAAALAILAAWLYKWTTV